MFVSRGVRLADSVRQNEQAVRTILFADLRDSTAMSEQLTTEAMVELLNAFLGALARPIIAHGGMVDKFLGDGVMGIFGHRADPTCGAIPALRAALAMRRAVRALNEQRATHADEPLCFGIGICTGEVIMARIGIEECSDFTAIGVTVNTAARLTGLCKARGVDIVLTDQTAAFLQHGECTNEFILRSLGEAVVQGRAAPVHIATLD